MHNGLSAVVVIRHQLMGNKCVRRVFIIELLSLSILHLPPFSPPSAAAATYPIAFSYLDADGVAVRDRSHSAQRQFPTNGDDGEGTKSGFRIACHYEQLIVSGLEYKMDWTAFG